MRAMDLPADATPVAAIVLAGGRSTRMRAPKAQLLFDGEPLIVHIVRTLRRSFDEVVVVAAPGQDLPPMPVTLAHDTVAHRGPVGGLCAGLAVATADVCFVTSCDCAFLVPTLIAHLVARSPSYDVVVPHWDGRMQPLHAVYRRGVLAHLEGQLARDELRPVFLFDKVRTLTIAEDEIRTHDRDGSSFINMNTPEDYLAAQQRWRQREPVRCRVELFGVARLIAQTRDVPLTLPSGSTFLQLFAQLARTLPALNGKVIHADGHLAEGYACNVNARTFIRPASFDTIAVAEDDRVALLSADAGG
jgi:molybdopterin-guanine dinucleotide biosynthesis protein A